MRVMVSGGLGFIGSVVAEGFVRQGHHVIVVDDFSGNVVDGINDTELWADSVTSPEFVTNAVDLYRVRDLDLIVHAASPVGAVGVLARKGRIVPDIVGGTDNVVSLAERVGARVINVSTSEVYGRSGEYHEADPCKINAGYNARREYAVGKLAAEYAVAGSGIDAVTIRPFNVAGPRQTSAKGFVLPTFCEQALAGEPVTVFGDGEQERAFTAVWDVASFIDTLIDHDDVTWSGETYNVGNPDNRTTIRELAARVLRQCGRGPDAIVHTDGNAVWGPDYAEADGFRKLPTIEYAQSLGWRPRHNLAALIRLTLNEVEAHAHSR